MSQVNSYDREQYATNGVTKTFSFGWDVNTTADVKVNFVSSDGALLNVGTFIDSNDDEYTTSNFSFTVELNQQGGTVTFVDTPADNQNIIIWRETDLVYENSFKTATAFPAAAIDKAYRKIWLALQEVQSDVVHNTVRMTPNQRDLHFGEFSESVTNCLVYYNDANKELLFTPFTVEDIDNTIGLASRVPSIANDAAEALSRATTAIGVANIAKSTADTHIADLNNPHQTTIANLKDTDINSPVYGQSLVFDGVKWKNKSSAIIASWGDIEGDINNQTDLKNALDSKQDVISDLTTIRSNASAGKSASETIATYGDIVTHDVSEFATAAQGTKADTALQPNDNVSSLINDAKYLSNTATATDAISVLGTSNTTWTNGINIGKDSRINSTNGIAIGVDASADVNAVGVGRDADAGVRGTAIGAYAKTNYDTGIAIGCWNSNVNNSVSSAKGAYQFGVGTNNTARTLNVGWYDDSVTPSTFRNYQLLDGNTGLIPDARISTNIARTTDIPGDFTGASAGDAGANGLVPAPAAGDQAKFLQGDGTWANPTAATAWGNVTGTLSDQTDLQNALDAKANTDLDNLTSAGQNISNWSSNVTNCATEIPQDINLELNSGTLTLKAGSKVYVPNGAGVFDEVVMGSDLVYNFGTPADGQYLIFNSQYFYLLSSCVSGATDSKAGQAYHSWYDTTNNLIKQYWADGSTPVKTDSLPVAIITISGGAIRSIDQVFNGFGCIGSIMFGLPGAKGLASDGFNADGTMKSIERAITSVQIKDLYERGGYDAFYINNLGEIGVWDASQFFIDTYPTPATGKYYLVYSTQENIFYRSQNGGAYTRSSTAIVGKVNSTYHGNINYIRTYTSFRVIDYNDTDYIVHQAMPSDKYTDLTLGASGTSYIAPADGWFYVNKRTDAVNQYLTAVISSYSVSMTQPVSGYNIRIFVPVKKGESVEITYSAGGATNAFRFIYTQGAK